MKQWPVWQCERESDLYNNEIVTYMIVRHRDNDLYNNETVTYMTVW